MLSYYYQVESLIDDLLSPDIHMLKCKVISLSTNHQPAYHGNQNSIALIQTSGHHLTDSKSYLIYTINGDCAKEELNTLYVIVFNYI